MCVLAIAWRAHPRWRLIVAANRDELHDRPAEPLKRWCDADVIAGRDTRAGGAWLAVSERGRFAAVTNLRGFGPPNPDLESRGTLVADLVMNRHACGQPSPVQLMRYNPFHAVIASSDAAWLLSNRPDAIIRPFASGIHALSNGPLDPPWSKMKRLSKALRHWIEEQSGSDETLFRTLRDAEPPPGSIDDPSALFIDDPVYGTRCSTLVMVDDGGSGRILERRYDRSGQACGDTEVRFDWP